VSASGEVTRDARRQGIVLRIAPMFGGSPCLLNVDQAGLSMVTVIRFRN